MNDNLKINKKERINAPLSETSDHVHDGRGSKKLNTANFVAVVPAAPAWDGREGEIAFESDGASTFKIWVWLGGGWREGSLT